MASSAICVGVDEKPNIGQGESATWFANTVQTLYGGNVLVLDPTTASTLPDKLEAVALSPDETLFVYMACHGSVRWDFQGVASYRFLLNASGSAYITDEALVKHVARLSEKRIRVTLFLDACYSGAIVALFPESAFRVIEPLLRQRFGLTLNRRIATLFELLVTKSTMSAKRGSIRCITSAGTYLSYPQQSADVKPVTAFTAAVEDALLRNTKSYDDLYNKIRVAIGGQNPAKYFFGDTLSVPLGPL